MDSSIHYTGTYNADACSDNTGNNAGACNSCT
jgi:hypothetical protein